MLDDYFNLNDVLIYDLNTASGVFTSDNGEFIIKVGLNDQLLVSSVQFEDFKVIVDQGVIDNKIINIKIKGSENVLEEVTVKPYNLSGDVIADVQKISLEEVKQARPNFNEEAYTFRYKFRPDEQSAVENIAIEKSYLTNGLNFTNMIKAIVKGSRKKENQNLDKELMALEQSPFFQQYIEVPSDRIPAFIDYLKNEEIDKKLFKKGNELNLIEHLIEKSEEFKLQQLKK
jgi:hypothetical protein